MVVCFERLKRIRDFDKEIADCFNCYNRDKCEIYISYRKLENRINELENRLESRTDYIWKKPREVQNQVKGEKGKF